MNGATRREDDEVYGVHERAVWLAADLVPAPPPRMKLMMTRRWLEIDNCFQVHGNAWVLVALRHCLIGSLVVLGWTRGMLENILLPEMVIDAERK